MTDKSAHPDAKPGEGGAARGALSLTEILPAERIELDVSVNTWQEAIQAAGKLLFETGAITQEYINAMVKVAEELGPYIAIAPGIALPHARPEAGALRTALSLVKLTQPVNFGNPDNDPVQLIFALAAVDNRAHTFALQALAELFLSKDLMKQLVEASSKEAVLEAFRQAEHKVGT
jgi:mannitol/fructose-specific phosphotransferase system IIA component (Ntr-type)